tara:strand:- start:162 stop:518 length:357 start_codon:yes stop_codon:yes gene_type:complete
MTAFEAFTEDIIKQLTSEVTAELGEATPVDTGWAQANWVPNLHSHHKGTVGSKEEVTQTAQAEGLVKVYTMYELPDLVFVSNNVSYIMRLNAGHSGQAPKGYVQVAILKAIHEVEKRV